MKEDIPLPENLETKEEPLLTELEKRLRDDFVREYLIDYSYTAAATRVGYNGALATEFGQRFRYDTYVQKRIAEAMQSEAEDEEFADQVRKRRVMSALLREANYHGPGSSHAARVSALAKIATIEGMEAPTKTESTVKHEGGLSLSHKFNFDTLSSEERDLVRKLLEGQNNADSRANT